MGHNELCTLEMAWSPSVSNFINMLLYNGYGVIIDPILDANDKVDGKRLLVTILDK